jgi:hypothetical protein
MPLNSFWPGGIPFYKSTLKSTCTGYSHSWQWRPYRIFAGLLLFIKNLLSSDAAALTIETYIHHHHRSDQPFPGWYHHYSDLLDTEHDPVA